MSESPTTNSPAPVPINLPRVQIFRVAERVAEKLNFKPGDPIEPIIKKLGGNISLLDLDAWFDEKSGSLQVHHDGSFTVSISAFSGPLRNRFTIAHELGHYILHSDGGKKPILIHRRTGTPDRLEWEANWFAAGFLMPTNEFKSLAESHRDPDTLAAFFQVSSLAATTRMKDLGITI